MTLLLRPSKPVNTVLSIFPLSLASGENSEDSSDANVVIKYLGGKQLEDRLANGMAVQDS